MKRSTLRVAVLVALVGAGCGKPWPAPAPEAERPAAELAIAPDAECPVGELAAAPAPRPRTPTFVVRSVRPADDGRTASRGFVVTYGLTDRNADLLARVRGVAGVVPVRAFASEVRQGFGLVNARVVGTTADYADARSLEMASGRFLDSADDEGRENVCVLGAAAADALFPLQEPIGKSVTIRSHEFKVVGVLKEGRGGANHDVFVPLATSRARFGDVIFVRTAGARTGEKVELTEVVVRMRDVDQIEAGIDAVRRALQRDRPQGDWEIALR